MVGLVHLYTGNGKGKTTAAFGLALRMVGRGKRVLIIQFMKGRPTGEVIASKKLEPMLEVRQFGTPRFVDPKNPDEESVKRAKEGLELARKAVKGDYDLVVLDEVNVAVSFGLLDEDEVLEVVRGKDKDVEVVLTGRYAPRSFYEIADYVTEFREVKHPFARGIKAREGVEY